MFMFYGSTQSTSPHHIIHYRIIDSYPSNYINVHGGLYWSRRDISIQSLENMVDLHIQV